MIKLSNVTKIYNNNKTALENISLNVNKGEIIFLTGKSGAGKSTLINLLTLREAPTNGQIISMGFDLTSIKKRYFHKYRRKIGVIFQDYNLIDSLSIFENIALTLDIAFVNKRLVKKRVFQTLEDIDLISQANSYPKELSGGERQRIAVARAIINKPELLIADEPTGNLDNENAKNIFDSLFTLNSMGATVIIATHDESVVSKGRQVKLERGKII